MKQIRYTPEARKKLIQMKDDLAESYGSSKASASVRRIIKAIDDLQIFEKKEFQSSSVWEYLAYTGC